MVNTKEFLEWFRAALADDEENALFLARMVDPARVLAEVEAKRQIIDHVLSEVDRNEVWWYEDTVMPVLRLLALPYADRPGYREEWRP